jgi:hypothetical protein
MTRQTRTHLALISTLLALALAILGCAVSTGATTGGGTTSGGGTTGPTPTPTRTPTPAPPPPHALAWFQMDGSSVGQIWASVNDGAVHQVTHQPASAAECRYDAHWSPPVFSPNLSNILAAWGSAACTDGPENGQLYIIDASTGAITHVPGATGVRLSLRESGWVDNTHIWWTDYNGVHEFTVGGGSATLLSNLAGTLPDDATLRGNILFFSTGYSPYTLRRFNMTSHTVLAGSVNLGTTNPCVCSRNDALTPGFDASADGSHIVFQRTAPAGSGGDEEGVGSSQFFYANADGSGEFHIASYVTAHSMTRMQISPNGQRVAIARAEPTPGDVVTASVSNAGNNGDPDLYFYGPSSRSYPVWKWDNTAFWASSLDLDDVYPPTTGALEHFAVGTAAGSVSAAGGSDPWYTIGS